MYELGVVYRNIVRADAASADALARIQADFRRAIGAVWPGAAIPF